jgi:hypothetical protein
MHITFCNSPETIMREGVEMARELARMVGTAAEAREGIES